MCSDIRNTGLAPAGAMTPNSVRLLGFCSEKRSSINRCGPWFVCRVQREKRGCGVDSFQHYTVAGSGTPGRGEMGLWGYMVRDPGRWGAVCWQAAEDGFAEDGS